MTTLKKSRRRPQYRIRVDVREQPDGGSYYGKRYPSKRTAMMLLNEVLVRIHDQEFVLLDVTDNHWVRSSDIVSVWVETVEKNARRVGYGK